MSSPREGGYADPVSPTWQVTRVRVPGPEAGGRLTQPRHDQCVTSGVSCPGAGFLGNPGTHTPQEPPQQVPWFARGTPGTQYTVISWLGLGAAQSYKAGLCKGRRCVGGARGNQEQVSGGLPVVATQEHHLPACRRLRAQAAHIGTLCRAPGPRLPGEAGLGTESHPDRLGSHGNPPQVQVPRCRPRADPRHSLGPAHHLLIPFQGLTCLRPSPLDLLPERGQS